MPRGPKVLPLSVDLASFTNPRPPAAPALELQRAGPRVRGGDAIDFHEVFLPFLAATFDSLRSISAAVNLALRGCLDAPAWVGAWASTSRLAVSERLQSPAPGS